MAERSPNESQGSLSVGKRYSFGEITGGNQN